MLLSQKNFKYNALKLIVGFLLPVEKTPSLYYKYKFEFLEMWPTSKVYNH